MKLSVTSGRGPPRGALGGRWTLPDLKGPAPADVTVPRGRAAPRRVDPLAGAARERSGEDPRRPPHARRVALGARRRRGRRAGGGRQGPRRTWQREPVRPGAAGDGRATRERRSAPAPTEPSPSRVSRRARTSGSTCSTPTTRRERSGGISLVAGGTRTGAVVTLRRGVVVTGSGEGPRRQSHSRSRGVPVAVARRPLLQRGRMMMQVNFGGVSDAPSAKSGPDGRFELKGIPAGDWAFRAKAPGWATETVDPLRLVRDYASRTGRRRALTGGGDRGLRPPQDRWGRRGLPRHPPALREAADGRSRVGRDADRAGRGVLPRRPEGRRSVRPATLRSCGRQRGARAAEARHRRAGGGRRVDRRGGRPDRGCCGRWKDRSAAHGVRRLLPGGSSAASGAAT